LLFEEAKQSIAGPKRSHFGLGTFGYGIKTFGNPPFARVLSITGSSDLARMPKTFWRNTARYGLHSFASDPARRKAGRSF